MSLALTNSGGLQIELIQPRNDAPSIYRAVLEAGYEGLQPMPCWAEDYQGLCDKALEMGCRVGHEGRIGGEKRRVATFDTEAHPGTVIEISDISGREGRTFAHTRRGAEGWDGSDPVGIIK